MFVSFCFVSISSFFLELFLHSYPVAYWAPSDLGNLSFSVISFCLFILFQISLWKMVGFAYRTYTGLEKQTRGGHKKPCVHQDPGEKSSDPTALTYSFPHLEQVCCSMSSSNFCFLTCIQISQEAGKVVWYFHFLKNFTVCCDPHSKTLWHGQ